MRFLRFCCLTASGVGRVTVDGNAARCLNITVFAWYGCGGIYSSKLQINFRWSGNQPHSVDSLNGYVWSRHHFYVRAAWCRPKGGAGRKLTKCGDSSGRWTASCGSWELTRLKLPGKTAGWLWLRLTIFAGAASSTEGAKLGWIAMVIAICSPAFAPTLGFSTDAGE